MARRHTGTSDQGSKLVPVRAVFVTDSLNFETEYLALRLTDARHLVEKKEQLIRSAMRCLDSVVTDDAEIGMLRRECSLFQIKVDPDREKARVELREQLAELEEQHKTLEAVIAAVEAAAKTPRTFVPEEYENLAPDSIRVIMASVSGKAIRFEIDEPYPLEPIETSDPRVVAELIRRQIGHPAVVG
jgi:hypothetical protein